MCIRDSPGGALTPQQVKDAFREFDLDKNGYVGAAEISHILQSIGEKVGRGASGGGAQLTKFTSASRWPWDWTSTVVIPLLGGAQRSVCAVPSGSSGVAVC